MGEKSPEFSVDDVRSVATALLEVATRNDVTRGMNAYNECRFCNGEVWWNEPDDKIVHESNCPVLKARDLMAEQRPSKPPGKETT